MSFYVTLPSNSSMDVYPNNTLSKFSTKLKTPIKLEGHYEVALVEIMYPLSCKYRTDGDIVLKYEETTVTFNVKFYVYETLSEMVEFINDYFQTTKIQMEIAYNIRTQKIAIMIPQGVTLTFTNKVEKEFGFTASEFVCKKTGDVFTSDLKVKNVLNTLNTLYVYSDIVEYQVVGDVNAPLLQVVASNHSSGTTYVDKIYDSPHYVPVSRSNIDSIEINILTEFGRAIQFTSGRVIVKLHFRRKNLF